MSTIGLWGRSMGAVTAIMYGDRDPSIAGMVLDSPFSSLKTLVEELVKDKVSLPSFIVNQALNLVKSTVQKKAKFKLEDIEPIKYAERCFIPSLFVAAKEDNFVKPHHSKILHDAYPGDKNLVNIEGDHNSPRPRFFKDSAAIFFYNTLQVQYIKEVSDNYAGFIYTVKKDEEENKVDNVESDSKVNLIVPSNMNNINNMGGDPDSNQIVIGNYDHGIEVLSDKMNHFDLGEDEEELFKKILEMSKKEFEDQQAKEGKEEVNNPKEEKEEDK